jgi:signal transduction histidine kinase
MKMGFSHARASERAQQVATLTNDARRGLVASSALRAVPMNIINAVLLSVFLFGHVDLTLHAIWFVTLSALTLGRLACMWSARQADRLPSDRAMTAYLLFSFGVGVAWGVVPLMVTSDAPVVVHQAIALVIAGMVAGAVMTSAAKQSVAVAYAAPALGLWALSLALSGTVFGWLLVVMLVGFGIALHGLARAYSNVLVEAVHTSAALAEAREETEAQTEAMTSLAERHEAAARTAEEQARSNAAILANMSHDLGTPLNGILGMSQILTDTDLGEEPNRMVGRIRTSAEKLSTLVSDILDVSRIQAGRLELVLDDVTPRELGERVERTNGPLAREKGLEFAVEYAGDADKALRGDENRLMQVISTFLENAIRFTDEGGITVRIEHDELENESSNLRVSVCDTGSGVPEGARDTLFDAFSRDKMDQSIREAGTGLGLHLASRLAELMNGSVSFEPLERGSSFSVELQLRQSNKADRYAESERLDLTSRRLRILAAERDTSRQSVLLGYLKSFNCTVTCASSGRELTEILNSAAYDAVVVGLELDDCAPEDVIADIRGLASTNSLTPILRLDAELSEPFTMVGEEVHVRAPVVAKPLLEGLRLVLQSDPTAVVNLRRIA